MGPVRERSTTMSTHRYVVYCGRAGMKERPKPQEMKYLGRVIKTRLRVSCKDGSISACFLYVLTHLHPTPKTCLSCHFLGCPGIRHFQAHARAWFANQSSPDEFKCTRQATSLMLQRLRLRPAMDCWNLVLSRSIPVICPVAQITETK